jgi:hypothetical protein
VNLATKLDLRGKVQPAGRLGRRARASGTPGLEFQTLKRAVYAEQEKNPHAEASVPNAGAGRLGRRA